MKLINTYTYIEKKSKFIGYYYQVENIDEIKNILKNLKLEHKKAKHFVYAYKIGPIASKSDDKEPTNTAGLPIYNLILLKKLDNILIVVVRYFGGIKLGAGHLTRAYSNTANKVILKEN